MQISALFRRENLTRFVQSARQEGVGAALARAASYSAMLLRGGGASSLQGAGFGPVHSRLPQFALHKFWQETARGGAFHVTRPERLTAATRRVAMIGDLNLPQCRKYRVEQLAELMEARGIAYGHAHYQDTLRAIALLQDASHAMFYRVPAGPLASMYLYEARRLGLPVLYDIDDPLFSVPAYETYANMTAVPPGLKAHFLSEAPKYLDAMNLADIVTVSTPGLRDHARLFTRRPVHLRRNFADRATFAAADRARVQNVPDRAGPFRVAFASGSMGHEADLSLIGDDLAHFLEGGDRRLLILGHFDLAQLPQAVRDRIEQHPFSDYDAYLGLLARADCAVMPLTDDIFNTCKSAVRVLDAAAVAVPSLVSDVGDLAAVVRDGATGRVMKKGDDWCGALEALAADRAATRRMGQAARDELERAWRGTTEPRIVDPPLLDWLDA